VYRDLATAAGLKLVRLPSGHSTRVGATQDIFAAGFELLEVMQAGSWKTPAMPARYGERLRAQRGAARKLATMQNRACTTRFRRRHRADHSASHSADPGPARSM